MEPACHGLCLEGGFWELLLTEALDHFRRGGTYCMLTLVVVIKTASWLYYILFKTLLFFFIIVPKDPKPQWRRVAWSYDCTLLAYAESTGTVRVFDLMGSELFVIAPVCVDFE